MSSSFLVLLGFVVGTFGTLVGAGGGFILVPILILLHPDRNAEYITSVSLAIVFLNSFSGSIAYGLRKKIDFKAGLIFAAASLPGAVIGAYSTQFLPRQIFDPVFATFLIGVGIYIYFRPTPKIENSLTNGFAHSFNLWLGVAISAGVGFVSSLLGIGGGIIHVPAMVHFLNFPVHSATATSHFVLAIMALFGTAVHLFNGSLSSGYNEIFWIAPGVLIGAQIGAKLSPKFHGKIIVRSLACALIFVGVRLLWPHLLPVGP
jgi:uncharacterized protein